jgi:hypothetical protein
MITRIEDGLWRARTADGEEGGETKRAMFTPPPCTEFGSDVLPIYLEPEVLFKATMGDTCSFPRSWSFIWA